MSTPPLLTLPTSSCIASVVMTLTSTTAITQSPFSKDEQAFKYPGQVWSIDFRMPPIKSRAVAAEWRAFAAKLQGRWGRFYMGDPMGEVPRGSPSGTPVVDGSNNTGSTLATSGWTPNTADLLLMGDYVQIGTGTNARLHMITADVSSDSSGDAILSLAPNLRGSPADGTAIVTSNPVGIFRMADDSFSWSVEPGPIYRLSFQAVEVVNA